MQYLTATLALAAVGMALPAPQTVTEPYGLEPAPTCERFRVSFMVDGQLVSANAVSNGTEVMVLEAQRLSAYPGTEAYFNHTNPDPSSNYLALNFVIDDDQVFGLAATNIGDHQGKAESIYAERDELQFEWTANNGTIGHKLYAASNGFYACFDSLVTGETNFFLKFGAYDFSTDSPPAGCNVTTVYQNYNVEGGLSFPEN